MKFYTTYGFPRYNENSKEEAVKAYREAFLKENGVAKIEKAERNTGTKFYITGVVLDGAAWISYRIVKDMDSFKDTFPEVEIMGAVL